MAPEYKNEIDLGDGQGFMIPLYLVYACVETFFDKAPSFNTSLFTLKTNKKKAIKRDTIHSNKIRISTAANIPQLGNAD